MVKVTTARSNQGHTMTLQSYTAKPISLPRVKPPTPYRLLDIARIDIKG